MCVLLRQRSFCRQLLWQSSRKFSCRVLKELKEYLIWIVNNTHTQIRGTFFFFSLHSKELVASTITDSICPISRKVEESLYLMNFSMFRTSLACQLSRNLGRPDFGRMTVGRQLSKKIKTEIRNKLRKETLIYAIEPLLFFLWTIDYPLYVTFLARPVRTQVRPTVFCTVIYHHFSE